MQRTLFLWVAVSWEWPHQPLPKPGERHGRNEWCFYHPNGRWSDRVASWEERRGRRGRGKRGRRWRRERGVAIDHWHNRTLCVVYTYSERVRHRHRGPHKSPAEGSWKKTQQPEFNLVFIDTQWNVYTYLHFKEHQLWMWVSTITTSGLVRHIDLEFYSHKTNVK